MSTTTRLFKQFDSLEDHCSQLLSLIAEHRRIADKKHQEALEADISKLALLIPKLPQPDRQHATPTIELAKKCIQQDFKALTFTDQEQQLLQTNQEKQQDIHKLMHYTLVEETVDLPPKKLGIQSITDPGELNTFQEEIRKAFPEMKGSKEPKAFKIAGSKETLAIYDQIEAQLVKELNIKQTIKQVGNQTYKMMVMTLKQAEEFDNRLFAALTAQGITSYELPPRQPSKEKETIPDPQKSPRLH